MNTAKHECDVLVIGAGPAGVAAAATAAESGARTIVVDEGFAPGGQIWRPSETRRLPGRARAWLSRLERSSATVLQSTSVVDIRATASAFTIIGERTESAMEICAERVVLATGARELFLPFPGWTLPNVVGIGGAQALLKAGTSFRGKRVVMSGSGPLMLPVARSLARAGAKLILVAEQASFGNVARYTSSLWRKPSVLAEAAALRWGFIGSRYVTGHWALAASGDDALREVVITDGRVARPISCDVLCTGFGLVPNSELARLAGCDVRGRAVVVDANQSTSIANIFAAGEPTGIAGVEASLVEGQIAGCCAAGRPADPILVARQQTLDRDAVALARAFEPRPEVRALAAPDTVMCRCEDVRSGDLRREWSARQAKLYTRVGMGPCQGRICGAALECVLGWPSDTVRPPSQPARLSTFAYESTSPTESPSTEQGAQ